MDLPVSRTLEDADGRAENALVILTSLKSLIKVISRGLGKRMVL